LIKSVADNAIFELKIHQNTFSTGEASPRTPLGSLQRSPDPLAGFTGHFAAEEGRRGEEEGRRELGRREWEEE